MKIARIATIPFFLFNHLRLQIIATVRAGHEVVLISSGGPEVDFLKQIDGVRFVQIDIQRNITPLNDLVSVLRLFWLLRKERFDVVHTTTPKAGMLGAIAASMARIPIRIHTFTGQAWSEMRGLKRKLAKIGDKITVVLNTRCYADSISQRRFMVEEGVAQLEKIHVLGAGSLAGVDLHRFCEKSEKLRPRSLLNNLGVPSDHIVITFVGRITQDKGVGELIASFVELQEKNLPCSLLLIGPEESDAKQLYEDTQIGNLSNVYRLGYQANTEDWLSVTDILCLPSYREGFGNVVIEAAAMSIPSVGTDIPGLRDAVVQQETGILVPVKNVQALAQALSDLALDDGKRSRMGYQARRRVRQLFDANKINKLVLEEYEVLQRECRR
jgi:glycosyltransferase involved in cell wall biosynthesis